MHDYFLDKLIERGRCEFGKIRVAFHKLDKLVCFQLVVYLARGVALIQLFHKPVQLLAPLPCLVDFLLALLGGTADNKNAFHHEVFCQVLF